jgi:hypothetical protein
MSTEITREVQQFIQQYLNSVEQLEVLLLLSAHSAVEQREWSAQEVSRQLYTQPHSAGLRLESLQEVGLVREVKPGRFCYSPSSRELDDTVRALGRAYRERKDSVIQLIFARPPEALRTFTKSLRLR